MNDAPFPHISQWNVAIRIPVSLRISAETYFSDEMNCRHGEYDVFVYEKRYQYTAFLAKAEVVLTW
jgi:hypothetical protein